ncbi:MAG: YeeE/YedE thiosulfate transporter family protein, partial [Lysobacterales bacterium]
MFFQRLKTPGLGQNSYVLGCGDGLAVVIDPRGDVDDYVCLARENDLSIAYVLETHRQEDFEFGSRTLAQMTGAKIVGGSHALFGETDVKLEDEEELEVGTTRFVALETPGHTPESMSYAVYVKDSGDKCWGVFTGDALFVGDTGRTDLPDPEKTGENAGILYDSVHRKIAPLGALIAAVTGGEFAGAWVPPLREHRFGPDLALRLGMAFVGGAILAYGARLAGGCTSGHGISGALQLSVSSWIALVC